MKIFVRVVDYFIFFWKSLWVREINSQIFTIQF